MHRILVGQAHGSVGTHAAALALITAYVFGLFAAVDPLWQTNDDVAMAMIAHGYGLATNSSPNLLFSTVAWGHVTQALHGLLPLQGYALAALLALSFAGWSFYL